MAESLPNGILFHVAEEYDDPVTVTAISNASTAVATAPGHKLAEGDIVEITSGWGHLNSRVVRVGKTTDDTFELEGRDTSNVEIYSEGNGIGSVRKIKKWTQVQQVISSETSGGDMQFATWSYLEDDYEKQKPTQRSAQSFTMTIADDPDLACYPVLRKASEERNVIALRARMPGGSIILYNGYLSFDETPTMTKNEVMTVSMTFSLQSTFTRYSK